MGKYHPYQEYSHAAISLLSSVPLHWNIKRLKFISSINDDVLPESTSPDTEFNYVDIGSVSIDKGIIRTEPMKFENAPSRARRKVKTGDVIVSTVRTYLKAIAAIEQNANSLVVSTGFCVVRPRHGLVPAYCGYLLQAPFLVEQIVSESVGVSYPAINASQIANMAVPQPSPEEQTQIAAFLDRETAKIDRLIDKQQQLIKLLEEKRQAVISHAVTKGLNPNAPMKDSGVEWLGQVPEHWKIKQLK
jgi:type I restriction enzyme S subunit